MGGSGSPKERLPFHLGHIPIGIMLRSRKAFAGLDAREQAALHASVLTAAASALLAFSFVQEREGVRLLELPAHIEVNSTRIKGWLPADAAFMLSKSLYLYGHPRERGVNRDNFDEALKPFSEYPNPIAVKEWAKNDELRVHFYNKDGKRKTRAYITVVKERLLELVQKFPKEEILHPHFAAGVTGKAGEFTAKPGRKTHRPPPAQVLVKMERFGVVISNGKEDVALPHFAVQPVDILEIGKGSMERPVGGDTISNPHSGAQGRGIQGHGVLRSFQIEPKLAIAHSAQGKRNVEIFQARLNLGYFSTNTAKRKENQQAE
jgi:hypothetical protein